MKEHNQKLGRLIKVIDVAYEKRFNQELLSFDITCSQFNVLRALNYGETHNKKMNQRDIETFLHLSNPTVTGILNRLEKKGFIERQSSEEDHRMKYILPTKTGRDLDDKVKGVFEDLDQNITQSLSNEEMDTLLSLLSKVADAATKKE